ncbi:MAG: aconitase family protein [Planctomycetota bacterium]|jgi:3-isopropylmalate/(R)-2-methylmalate dehydratase large subunit
MAPNRPVSLTPGKRVLFLTKDFALIRRQLRGELDLTLDDVRPKDLLDDINTDVMTPAWVCFDHEPEELAKNAYAGLVEEGERVVAERALYDGGFEVIVSGERKGVGSSRETAVQAERWCGIRIAIAASFAPIHAANNINQGLLMGDYDVLRRLQAGEAVPLQEFMKGYDPIRRLIVAHGGLFAFSRALAAGEVEIPRSATGPRPMTMAEKVIARHLVGGAGYVRPGDAVMAEVDGGYSHEFTSAQVHYFLQREYGADYRIANPARFAVFEDHLHYADGVANMAPFVAKIQTLRELQRVYQRHTGVRDHSVRDGVSPGICHQVAREQLIEPGDLILATDSHTTMGGGSNAYAYGVGATEFANLVHAGATPLTVPESIRFELVGALDPSCTAKDIMLFILMTFVRRGQTLNRCLEFGGPGLKALSMDERATLANMATECSARAGMVEADDETIAWIVARRPGADAARLRERVVRADPDARYDGGIHTVDLSQIRPMVAHPGDPDRGVPSDPTNGAFVDEIGDVAIDIAYAGSCTAGKIDDLEMYARVLEEAVAAGRTVAEGVQFYVQYGSVEVKDHCERAGLTKIFARSGATILSPGCGACIGCGPGVSERREQVTVSAINRNYTGRSGPGKLYLASPLTVAASAIVGRIVAYRPGMFAGAGSV